jgi:formamidopyrimidine-DNA glycosylase
MPELPEVETVRRGLAERVAGRKVLSVEVGRERTVRRTSREALIDGLLDVRIESAGRRGKYLLLPLDSGNMLMVHLRMSGQLLLAPAGAERPPHTHVALGLEGDEELWFVDPRTFGEVVVYDPANVEVELPEVARLGIDPLHEDEFTRPALAKLLKPRKRAMKALLLDQHVVAGIGNIYADEVLHRSKLRYDHLASDLTTRQVGTLHQSISEILGAAVTAGGSTLRDARYVDLMGGGGYYQDFHRVYDREDQQCLTCGKARIVKTVVAGRSTYYCPRCQG